MSGCHNTNVTLGCFDGTPVLIHVIDDGFGKPATRIVDVNGDVVPGADASNTFPGACPVPATRDVSIVPHGQNFASPSLQADYDPNGNGPTWTQPAGVFVQSFTVIVRKAGKTPGGANRVLVNGLPEGKYFLSEGDVRTWSVSQDASRNELIPDMSIEVTAEGDSAFDVIWTAEV